MLSFLQALEQHRLISFALLVGLLGVAQNALVFELVFLVRHNGAEFLEAQRQLLLDIGVLRDSRVDEVRVGAVVASHEQKLKLRQFVEEDCGESGDFVVVQVESLKLLAVHQKCHRDNLDPVTIHPQPREIRERLESLLVDNRNLIVAQAELLQATEAGERFVVQVGQQI